MIDEPSGGFGGVFLGTGDLPAGMSCIRDARDSDLAPPGDVPDVDGWTRAGWTTWFAPADADVYRVDDMRWLFESAGQAAAACLQLRRAPAPPADRFVRVLQVGSLVARLQVTQGDGAALDEGYVTTLADAVVTRATTFEQSEQD